MNLFKLTLLILCLSCGSSEDSNVTAQEEWLIPRAHVLSGGPGKDGIPAVDNPKFTKPGDIDFVLDHDLVLAIKLDGDIRAYPHPILDQHEIVNDEFDNTYISITYCPLTGTGIGWDRVVNGNKTTFGVSGLLYNTNLIPYDRKSNSLWSQMRLECVNGDFIREKTKNFNLFETTWKTWKQMYPDADVLNDDTGYNKVYGLYPYDDYRENNNLILFPITVDDTRLPRKERVLGVIGQSPKVYRFDNFTNEKIGSLTDIVNGEELIIVGSRESNFIVAFNSKLSNGLSLTLAVVEDDLPNILKDTEGSVWNIFGEAVSGPRIGQKLNSPDQMMGYWFSFATFYSDIDIYQ